MPRDPAILAHQEWLGYVQPTGLVVSIPSLIDASAFLNRNYGPEHQTSSVGSRPRLRWFPDS